LYRNTASKGTKVAVSTKQKASKLKSNRADKLQNSRARDFVQDEGTETPSFRLFHGDADGAIVSWFHVREADYEVRMTDCPRCVEPRSTGSHLQ
jgi:hypothetical protein